MGSSYESCFGVSGARGTPIEEVEPVIVFGVRVRIKIHCIVFVVYLQHVAFLATRRIMKRQAAS